ncbi:MAG: hypothetical protein ABNH26_08815 [Celeribacter sp.]
MADRFENYGVGTTSPATRQYAITPTDGVDLDPRPRALFVLTDGDLVIRDELDAEITYPVTAGSLLPFRAVGIEATGTTATVAGWD